MPNAECRPAPRLTCLPAFVALAIGVSPACLPGEEKEPSVTFAEHVAPIVFENCTVCHRPGQGAPFDLTTYEETRENGRLIAKVTRDRYMPPWHARSEHASFLGERSLDDAEIEVFQRWLKAGMPEGDASKTPSLPEFPSGWALGEPDLVLTMKEAFPVPSEGPDIYRHFALPTDLPDDKWIRAIDFRPGVRSVVHHSLFFIDKTGTARLQDGRPGKRPGFSRMPGGLWESSIGGWAVGGGPIQLPEGMAYRLPAGSDIVLQTHFHPTGKEEEERSTLAFYFSDEEPEKEFTFIQLPPLFGAIRGLDIPPGSDDYAIEDSFELPVDVLAFGVSAHAHYLGKEMKVTATLPEGEEKVLMWIPDWDFSWQEQYRFEEFIRLPRGTVVHGYVRYDNTANNPDNPFDPPRLVNWGPMSEDEMGSVTLDVTPVDPADIDALEGAFREHTEDAVLDRFFAEMTKNPERTPPVMRNIVKSMDADGDGTLSREEKRGIKAFLKANGMWDRLMRIR